MATTRVPYGYTVNLPDPALDRNYKATRLLGATTDHKLATAPLTLNFLSPVLPRGTCRMERSAGPSMRPTCPGVTRFIDIMVRDAEGHPSSQGLKG